MPCRSGILTGHLEAPPQGATAGEAALVGDAAAASTHMVGPQGTCLGVTGR